MENSFFQELTQEGYVGDAELDTITESITTEHAMEASADATALEFQYEATVEQFASAVEQAGELEVMVDIVRENMTDSNLDLFARALTALSHANGLDAAFFSDSDEMLVAEAEEKKKETEGTFAKIKMFAANVYQSLKRIVAKAMNFLKKWTAKAMVFMLKGDSARKELADKLAKIGNGAAKVKVPKTMLGKIQTFLRAGQDNVTRETSSAALTFNTAISKLSVFDAKKELRYGDISSHIDRTVDSAEKDDKVTYVGRGVFYIICEKDGAYKVKKAKIKAGLGSKVGENSTLGDVGIDFAAVISFLKKSKADLQKQVNTTYEKANKEAAECLSKLSKLTDKSEILDEKKKIAALLKVSMKGMSGISTWVKDATRIANIVVDAGGEGGKEGEDAKDTKDTKASVEAKVGSKTEAVKDDGKGVPVDEKKPGFVRGAVNKAKAGAKKVGTYLNSPADKEDA